MIQVKVENVHSSNQLSVVLLILLGFTRHHVEGICSVEHCNDPTRCVLSEGQRSCKCTSGYYADQCDKNANIKVMCGRDYMAIRATEDFFNYYNVPLESLHLPNKSCRAQRVVMDGVPYYMSRIPKDQYLTCGGKPLEKNFTHVFYSMSLLSDPQVIGNIIRDPVIKMDFTCLDPYLRRVSLTFPVLPSSRVVRGDTQPRTHNGALADSGKGTCQWDIWCVRDGFMSDFVPALYTNEMVMRVDELDATIQMTLYTDDSYSNAYSSAPTIELGDKVYVEVTVTEPADFFLLMVSGCWATQSPQPNSTEGYVHTLLRHGCVDDKTVSFFKVSAEQSGRNGESSTTRYSFNMFRFLVKPHELYLHCTVQLCEPDDHKSCTPNCNSISKREVVKADPTLGLLSYGPIRIEMPDRNQSNILMTVVLPVAGVWIVGFFFIILIIVAKAGSRRLPKVGEQ